MAKLIYSAITSLDGFVADENGNFEWAAPDAEIHAHVNDLERPIGTYLYGRRMYEVMAHWATAPTSGDGSPVGHDYARIWQAADKIVYSSSLDTVPTERTRLEREFDPPAVMRLKEEAAQDITVGGPNLAAAAIKAGLVDEYQVYLTPVVVGGGNHWLPSEVFLPLDLTEQRCFGNGVVFLRYRSAADR